MKIGCVKEIKNNEFRVGLTPDNVRAYIAAGHHVYIEKGAGIGSGFSDNEYSPPHHEKLLFRSPSDSHPVHTLLFHRSHARGTSCRRPFPVCRRPIHPL